MQGIFFGDVDNVVSEGGAGVLDEVVRRTKGAEGLGERMVS